MCTYMYVCIRGYISHSKWIKAQELAGASMYWGWVQNEDRKKVLIREMTFVLSEREGRQMVTVKKNSN